MVIKLYLILYLIRRLWDTSSYMPFIKPNCYKSAFAIDKIN